MGSCFASRGTDAKDAKQPTMRSNDASIAKSITSTAKQHVEPKRASYIWVGRIPRCVRCEATFATQAIGENKLRSTQRTQPRITHLHSTTLWNGWVLRNMRTNLLCCTMLVARWEPTSIIISSRRSENDTVVRSELTLSKTKV
jgi:hypothetical protein